MATQTHTGLSLELRRTFSAPVSRVYDAWSNSDAVLKWFCPGKDNCLAADFNPVQGAKYSIRMRSEEFGEMTVEGVFQEVIPEKRLVFTWGWVGVGDESQVTVEFNDADGGTELVLNHVGLETPESKDNHRMGWDGTFDNLESLIS